MRRLQTRDTGNSSFWWHKVWNPLKRSYFCFSMRVFLQEWNWICEGDVECEFGREQPGSYKTWRVLGNPAAHPGFPSPATCFPPGENKPVTKTSIDLPEPQQLPPDSRSYRKAEELPICKSCQGRYRHPAKPFPLSLRALANSSNAFQFPGQGTC